MGMLSTLTRAADDDAAPDLEPAADVSAPTLTPDGWPAFAEQRRPGHFAATWTINVVTNAAVTAAVADRLSAVRADVEAARAAALASPSGQAWQEAARRLAGHKAELARAAERVTALPGQIAAALLEGRDPAGLEAQLAAARADHGRLGERSAVLESDESGARRRYDAERGAAERKARSAAYAAAARELEATKERLRQACAAPLAEVFVASRAVAQLGRELGLR